MQKNIKKETYYTPDQVLDMVYTGSNGKRLISKTSFLTMVKKGIIPSSSLGMQRRYFIPASFVEELLKKGNFQK